MEDCGRKIKDMVVNKNPFPNIKCEEKKKCLLCNSDSSSKIPCNSNNVGYRLVCETCKERGLQKVYEGKSARSTRIRATEHMREFKNKKETSALFKHKQTEHEAEDMKFSMEITRKFKDPLSRQANEAVRISSRATNELLNSKNEFNHPPIARTTLERKNKFQYKKVKPAQTQLNQ